MSDEEKKTDLIGSGIGEIPLFEAPKTRKLSDVKPSFHFLDLIVVTLVWHPDGRLVDMHADINIVYYSLERNGNNYLDTITGRSRNRRDRYIWRNQRLV
jgi:hypothetical protein